MFDTAFLIWYYNAARECRSTGETMREDISTVEYASLLYDFYGALLSDSQNEVMALYHEDNLSLSEIAADLGTTRQAVHYTLKKAEHALKDYEDKLGLVAAYKKNQELAARAAEIIGRAGIAQDAGREILSIIEQITE